MISWPFQEAEKILQRFPNQQEIIFETGYGPSGIPHIGTFGEFFRTKVVMNALKHIAPNIKTKLIVFSDDMDGLRKIPEHMPNQDMLKNHLNKPLSMIPDPFGSDESYSDYMNSLLCKFLNLFDLEYEFMSATHCYQTGIFDKTLSLILRNYKNVIDVIVPSLRIARKKTYSPFLPLCPYTSCVLQAQVIEVNTEKETIVYLHPNGQKIETIVTQGKCKLQWKADWGMRWAVFNVHYEAHGKDLTPSATLSSQICQILKHTPPLLFCYELFLDQRGTKISKSKGNGLSIEKWLTYSSIESLSLYIFQNPKKAKRLYFDVIPKSTDAYLDCIRLYHTNTEQDINNPVWHIHSGNVPVINTSGINFTLLLNLATACHAEHKQILWGFISHYQSNVTPENSKVIDTLADFAVKYYHDFIKPKKSYKIPNIKEKIALFELKQAMEALSIHATSEEIQAQILSIGIKCGYNSLRDWFQLLYETLLGQQHGPRIGSFIQLYGINNTITLVAEVLKK
ncbi:lysine--tRNA ligase [Wolbachia endosymbiont of Howardula sp.]|uniref:lysine--tRNA ligase n=1 Tax=Wolbachia endosymbiont of Howardula sp. TaxID=2916816 RepID=UPI00217E940F|nr:lysine--tRNA ligase [Wolbachia endosymbiont of Howardula sp.]UWI83392.1 lysine--tRNA ligase [Wolbachia endosymbiont of Howardula sp.]